MRIFSTCRTLVVFILAALATVGCDRLFVDPNDPTPPDLESVTDLLTEELEVGGELVFVLDILKREYTQVTLVGIFTTDPRRPLNVPLRLSLGPATAEGCSSTTSAEVTPSFSAHLRAVLDPRTYCIVVSDPGTLTENVGVMVRAVHPAPIAQGNPGTVTASSNITMDGASTRTFDAPVPGTAVVTLTNLQPSVEVGLGMGIQATDGTGCRLTQVMTTTARSAPHFTRPVDPGTYCVSLYDIGNFTQTTSYTITIAHP
jgi:hypothetical protein